MKELQAIVRILLQDDLSGAVLATLVRVEGSSYRRPGARLLLLRDGRRVGTISGGCLEEDVVARAGRVAKTQQPEAVVYDTTAENDLVWGVGLGCHGIVTVLLEPLHECPTWARLLGRNLEERRNTPLEVTYGPSGTVGMGTRVGTESAALPPDRFIEAIEPPLQLCIFGAGDDARPLSRMAKELGWRVLIADPRTAFATPQRFPEADSVVTGPIEDLVDRVAPDTRSAAVVMTHHYIHDVPLLRRLSALPLAYLGLLGPKKRAERIVSDLLAGGIGNGNELRHRLHAPVGLDLGADGPEAVALSIVAEIQAVLAGRSGRPLRERTSPIHTLETVS